jgi:chromosome segregation ATPase
MRLEKRMKMELRDIAAKKKEAQDELSALMIELGLLREEKQKVMGYIETACEDAVRTTEREKQNVEVLNKQLRDITQKLVQSEEELVKVGVKKTSLEEVAKRTQEEISYLNDVKETLHSENRGAMSRLDELLSDVRLAEKKKFELLAFLGDTQSSISVSELALKKLNESVLVESQKLEAIRGEQKKHSNWSQYLTDKEDFLKEQFHLLGVKYVMYNR